MSTPSFQLADIFRCSFPEYVTENKPLPPEHYKVANALTSCHTAALGGHVLKCDECRHIHIAYNSCRNRHCPSCQAVLRAEWVDKRVKELLPVPYFHVVFTVPAELNPFALRNKKVFYSILFKAAAETLHACAERTKFLGADIGFIAVLHTWGQNLLDHPHLHCVVPAGGLSKDRKQWKNAPQAAFLFPVAVVAKLFRGKFLAYFREAVTNNEIVFHGALETFMQVPCSFGKFIDTLYKKEWVVYLKAPFAGPEVVLKYLGRYTHRIAISNSRIQEVNNETVSFTWKDYADNNKQKLMTLSHGEFIRRFLLHVVPTGFVRIRYFGFLGQAVKKELLQLCRLHLQIPQEVDAAVVTKKNDSAAANVDSRLEWWCPECKKGRLVRYREFPRPHHRNIERAAVA
jgi:Putative transposase/Transposase zinc-binding domain